MEKFPAAEVVIQGRDDELIIGLVGPIGVDVDFVAREIKQALKLVGYKTKLIQMTKLLRAVEGFAVEPGMRADKRYLRLMKLGNRFREEFEDPARMARLAVAEITRRRDRLQERGEARRAFVLRQLKRPEEVATLRELYGDNFLVVAIHGDRQHRVETLATMIADSANEMSETRFRNKAEKLVRRDEDEGTNTGQALRDTFAMADLFLDPSNPKEARAQIERLVGLLFGLRISTPTKDEYAMYVAKGSAMLSASLARQVGAVITDSSGAILATGTNDVPKAHGGTYWEGDPDDNRDHVLTYDPSDRLRDLMLAELFEELARAGWLSRSRAALSGKQLSHEALRGDDPILKKARVNAVIEYIRAAHAEQAALLDSARRGVAVQGTTLVVTTFPCHECTRLLLISGVARVVFIEPYPKSLATVLYRDEIEVGRQSGQVRNPSKLQFEPFLGVAPQQYSRLFEMANIKRKDSRGTLINPNPKTAVLRRTRAGERLDTGLAEAAFVKGLDERG